jgi:phage shock protein E
MSSWNVVAVVVFALFAWQIIRMFVGKVAPEKAKALVEGGALLVDVRSPGEHASFHLPGSINVPVGEVSARLGELGDKQKPVVVYCASGVRSASAVGTLRAAGFTDVHDLGGLSRWPG